MKRGDLEREGKAWVEEGIITEEQFQQILDRKQEPRPQYVIMLFAVLLTGLGFLTFIMSDWAREPHISRVLIIAGVTLFFYISGDVIYRKKEDLFGIGFIVLGYIVFGAGLLLVIDIYQVILFSAWPYVIWTAVGLALYYLYEHRLLFAIAMLGSIAGQIHSGLAFSDFNWLLFTVLVLGFGYSAYRKPGQSLEVMLAVNLAIQSIVLTAAVFEHFYWYMLWMLALYLVGEMIRNKEFHSIQYIALAAVFLFGMYQTFLLDDEWFMPRIPDFEAGFFFAWLVLFLAGIVLKWKTDRLDEGMDYALFLPIIFLPGAYILSLIVLFVFALGWIFKGYRNENQLQIMLGTAAFLGSAFTAYVQFAWDALDKSLFFFIGGVLLFLISFIMERQRRRLVSKEKGSGGR